MSYRKAFRANCRVNPGVISTRPTASDRVTWSGVRHIAGDGGLSPAAIASIIQATQSSFAGLSPLTNRQRPLSLRQIVVVAVMVLVMSVDGDAACYRRRCPDRQL